MNHVQRPNGFGDVIDAKRAQLLVEKTGSWLLITPVTEGSC
jgi:hypothetical protein